MTSILYFVSFLFSMSMMSMPDTLTVQGLHNYPRNLTANIFTTGQLVTKSRVDSEKRGNSDCMFHFEGACSLIVRVNTIDNATCNKLDINNTRVSPCCNTGNWCTVSGSRINLGTHNVTTDCSNISIDVKVLSLTCHGSSINCEDHQRSCADLETATEIPTDAGNFTITQRSTTRFTSMTTESPLSQLSITVNMITPSNSFNSALPTLIQNFTSFSSNHAIATTIPKVHVTPTTVSIATSMILPSQTTWTSQKLTSGATSIERLQTQSSPRAYLQTTVPASIYIDPSTTFQTGKAETNISKASLGFDFDPLTGTYWTTLEMINSTLSSNLATKQIDNNEPTLDTVLGTNLQTTVPTVVYINPGTTSQTDKINTHVSKAVHNTDSNPLSSTDWNTSNRITSSTSSNSTLMQTDNNESTVDNIQGTNTTNATSTESPDVINTESAMISMYTFLAVFGAVLLAVIILVCVCFCRTKSPKISQKKAVNEPDKDVIQRLHSSDFSPQTPYCINPVYQDYFDERRNAHVPKQDSYGETVCRVHPPTPTLPTHCCSGQSDWSLSPSQSKLSNSSTPGDIYGFSYKKTDYYVDNISGDESDV